MGRGSQVSTALTRSTCGDILSTVVLRTTQTWRKTCLSISISTAPSRPTKCERSSESLAPRATYASGSRQMGRATPRLAVESAVYRKAGLRPSWPRPFRISTPFGLVEPADLAGLARWLRG